jgi:hypothetical protein
MASDQPTRGAMPVENEGLSGAGRRFKRATAICPKRAKFCRVAQVSVFFVVVVFVRRSPRSERFLVEEEKGTEGKKLLRLLRLLVKRFCYGSLAASDHPIDCLSSYRCLSSAWHSTIIILSDHSNNAATVQCR